MLQSKNLSFGKLYGTIYDFPFKGDILPMHWHTEDNVHITVVARGSFTARGQNWDRVVLAGDVIDWEPEQWHEFVALEDNSRIVNIIKGTGIPGEVFVEEKDAV
jgi:quercetin dioxygenase-like cupin family protein